MWNSRCGGFVQLIWGRWGADTVAGPHWHRDHHQRFLRAGDGLRLYNALYNVFSMIVLLSVNLGALNLFSKSGAGRRARVSRHRRDTAKAG